MVNASNRVTDINLNQTGDIFSGKAKTWDEFGGLENKVLVIEREEGKGVRPYFEQLLNLSGKMVNGKGVVEPDKEAIRVVSGSLNAVSYINLSVGLNNVTVGVPIRLLSINKVEPEPANVSSGAYPLRRPVVAVTKKHPTSQGLCRIHAQQGRPEDHSGRRSGPASRHKITGAYDGARRKNRRGCEQQDRWTDAAR